MDDAEQDTTMLEPHAWQWAYDPTEVERLGSVLLSDGTLEAFQCPPGTDDQSRLGTARALWFLDLQYCGGDVSETAERWLESARENEDNASRIFERESATARAGLDDIVQALDALGHSDEAHVELVGFLMAWTTDAEGQLAGLGTRFDEWENGSPEAYDGDRRLEGTFFGLSFVQQDAARLAYLVQTVGPIVGTEPRCGPKEDAWEASVSSEAADVSTFIESLDDRDPEVGAAVLQTKRALEKLPTAQTRDWMPLVLRSSMEMRFHAANTVLLTEMSERGETIQARTFTEDERSTVIENLDRVVRNGVTMWIEEQIGYMLVIIENPEEAHRADILPGSQVLLDMTGPLPIECPAR